MKGLADILSEAKIEGAVPHHIIKTSQHMSIADLHNKIFNGLRKNRHYKNIGEPSTFGAVFKVRDAEGNEKDPFSVVKIAASYTKNPNADPYISYIKRGSALSHSNPHFPRIHSITSVMGTNGNIHVVKMEPLTSWGDSDAHTKMAAYHHAFGTEDDYSPALRGKLEAGWRGTPHLKQVYSTIRDVSDKIHNSTESRKEYRRGIDIPRHRVSIDIHSGNYMVRHSNTGPQLVIIDPLADHEDIRRKGIKLYRGLTAGAHYE